MTDNNDNDNDINHPNIEQDKIPEKESKEKKIDEIVKDNIPEEKPKETKEKSLSNASKAIDESQEIKSIEKKIDIFEKRFNKIDETLQSIVKILRDKINYDLLRVPKISSYRNKKSNKLLQNKTRRNGVIKIKEEDIYDELYRENLNEEKSTRESKKSWEEDKKYTKKKQEDLHKDLNDNNNTYDINIDNNTAENNSIGSANEAPTRKNIEAYSNSVNGEEKRKNLSYDSKNQKENNDEITSPHESEQEQSQNEKYQQYPSQNSEMYNNQNQDKDESSHKYEKNNNKKRSLLSKKFTKHKNSRRKRQESSYSPSIYNKSRRRVSQSMVNYNQVQGLEDENERNSEEELSDEQLEKERIEREKKRNEKRERSEKNEKESTFKYYFDGHIINNKKVRWEVKIKQLTGWFSIGVAERQKTSNTNEKQNPITVDVNKQYIINKINFLMTNDHCTIIWIGNKNQINQFKGVFGIKQGDILTFTFCPKFSQLKIQKNNNTYLIDKINYYGDQWLVPCAIYSRKSDKALFRNFHVLADYNN